ncbi:MAG: hypothetical protein ACOX02_02815 [Acholeplasmatales bacterium]
MAKSNELLKLNDYEALKVSPFNFEFLQNKGFGYSEDINELYLYQIESLKKDLFNTLENNPVVKVFFYDIDAVNTKIIYKHINSQTSNNTMGGGNIRVEAIYNALKHNDLSLLDMEDKPIFEKLLKFKGNYKETSEYIDYLFYVRKYELAKYKELKAYLDVEVTLKNILSIIRNNLVGTKTNLLPFGLVEEVMPLSELVKYASNLYVGYLEKPLNEYLLDKDLEKLSNAFMKDFYYILKDYEYDMDSFGIIMLYVYKKMVELENIKAIYYNENISLSELVIL